jgi:hypothetical protein
MTQRESSRSHDDKTPHHKTILHYPHNTTLINEITVPKGTTIVPTSTSHVNTKKNTGAFHILPNTVKIATLSKQKQKSKTKQKIRRIAIKLNILNTPVL